MQALIVLEDGTVYRGTAFGYEGEKCGELVFNTSMSGYQEIMTDPSYKGQIVTMTYPLIGNYGINSEDIESSNPKVEGFIAREFSKLRSNFRSELDINDYLKKNRIIGVEGVDTRAITRKLRTSGAMRAILSATDHDVASLLAKVKNSPSMDGLDLAKEVTCRQKFNWTERVNHDYFGHDVDQKRAQYKVVAMDFGMKYNILRFLTAAGCSVTVVPAAASAREILAENPDGIFLSNGPGDPAAVTYAIETIKQLLETGLPIFGICLGHQMLGLAMGGRTYKLKFGHRGANHPVKDLVRNRIEITSQNHGFAVDIKSLPADVEVTHVNLNDKTVSGLRHKTKPIFGVQFHPEASPGPHDACHLFNDFVDLIRAQKKVAV